MPFSSAAVANEFLRLAFRDRSGVTPLKMQKLVYFAHGWHLAITGRPLLRENIQAWQWGPVIPSLYQQFKECGSAEITFPASAFIQGGQLPANLDSEGTPKEVATARQIIERVWEQYGKYTAAELTTLTHGESAPWAQVPDKEKHGTVIPDELIREYFVRQATAVS